MAADHEKNFFENMIDSVIAVDKEGKVREVNSATLELLGYKKKEEMAMLPFEKICKNFSLKELEGKMPLQEQELMYSAKEGKEIPVSVNIVGRVSYPNDIVFMARDTSKIKRLIDELTESQKELKNSYSQLRDSKDELIRSEKLAYTGRVAASVAHEVRNPLTNAAMSIQQLKKNCASKCKLPKLHEIALRHYGIMEKNIERINYLITELLNCARPPKLNLEPYEIHRVLENILDSVKTKLNLQRIKVVKELARKPRTITVDKEQMGRALLNIILNAIEAMPKGGRLTVITESNENLFIIRIEDTGKGIPQQDIIRIFDPFFSTKYEGVGLGLTLCYGIIVSHGGTIEVESKLRKGTTLTVSLPVEQKLRERERES